MDNNHETEEELKERLRKEILQEMNNGSAKQSENIVAQSYGMAKKNEVKFNGNNGYAVSQNENNNLNSEEPVIENSGNSKGLLIILLIIVIISIFLFPKIYDIIAKGKRTPKHVTSSSKKQEEVVYEPFKLDDSNVVNAKYPIMHFDTSSKNSYYTLDSVTIKNFSNNDILVSALADTYEGSMAAYNGKYDGKACVSGANKLYVSSRYLKIRIDNLFGTDTSYKLTDINVYTNNPKTKYTGVWKYNNGNYIYYGDCSGKSSNIIYDDIHYAYNVENEDKNTKMYIYNYVAFIVVDKSSKNYVIYKNADYTDELAKGKL